MIYQEPDQMIQKTPGGRISDVSLGVTTKGCDKPRLSLKP